MPTIGSLVTLRCRSFPIAPAAALVLAAGLSSGCGSAAKPASSDSGSGSAVASNSGGGSASSSASSDAAAGPATPGDALVQSMASELAQRYVVGPLEVDKLGYRVDWNVNNGPTPSRIKLAVAQGDSFFTIDQSNMLTRIRRDTGDRLWRTPVAEPVEAVHGITRITTGSSDLVHVTTHSDVWVFEAQNGAFVAKNNLFRVGSTSAAQYGPYLIYGSDSGQVVWFQHEVGTQWRAYQLSGSIHQPPVRHQDLIVVVTEDGETSALDAGTTARYWSKRTRANVVAPPAVGPQAVYVVSLDQHIYAYDLNTGRVRWFRLTDSALRHAPVYLNNTLYVYVPSEGLQAFDPMPADVYYDGRVLWTAEGVSGEVVGSHRGRLIVWDREARVMSLLTAANGDVVERIPMPKVNHLVVDGMNSGEIYAIGDDGKVLRMVPRS